MSQDYVSVPAADRPGIRRQLELKSLGHFSSAVTAMLEKYPDIPEVSIARGAVMIPLCGGVAVLSGGQPHSTTERSSMGHVNRSTILGNRS